MPPTVEAVPFPTGRGESAMRWLSAHGLNAFIPPIRASSFNVAIADPFQFYLQHRLGIVPAFLTSQALAHGTWFHKAAEFFDHSAEVRRTMIDATLAQREREIRATCQVFNISDPVPFISIDRQDALNALTWFDAAIETRISRELGTLHEYLSRPYWQTPIVHDTGEVAIEVTIVHNDPAFPRTPLVIQVDRFLYHTTQNTLWILDWKTCRESPLERLKHVELTFNTRHYSYVVMKAMENGFLQQKLGLPENATFGGFIHAGIQKPTIRLSQNDRDFDLVTRTPTRGANAGTPIQEKVYHGEPRVENYLRRVKDWYHSTGDYAHQALDREQDPPVNLAFTRASFMDSDTKAEYTAQLKYLYALSIAPAIPSSFARNGTIWSDPISAPTRYLPFHTSPVHLWPDIMRDEKLIVSPRAYQATLEF